MGKIIILTGPAGAGKNTVGHILAQLRHKCAVIDVDDVRHMAIKPHIAPWYGEPGQKQARLGAKNAVGLAKNFIEEGFDCVILDVVTKETSRIYKDGLKEFKPKIVLLFPTLDEVKKRNSNRSYNLQEERLISLHEEQSKFENYDEKIDNTNLSAEKTAEKINSIF
ncbi:MAG TPA: AAA family ATPase [Patescibacteria group bacterium]|nr:AAA family ATPase [Patescibacteria group bacterium]